MKTIKLNSDHLGVISGLLCIAHCAFTPVLFLSQTQFLSFAWENPVAWKSFNFLFLIISFTAIWQSIKNSTNSFIKLSLFVVWVLLCVFILNELFELYIIPELFTYSAAILLCGLHLYNLSFCRCKEDDCCIHKT